MRGPCEVLCQKKRLCVFCLRKYCNDRRQNSECNEAWMKSEVKLVRSSLGVHGQLEPLQNTESDGAVSVLIEGLERPEHGFKSD